MNKYFRSPVAASWRKSPFVGLLQHATLVRECGEPLRRALEAYISGDKETFDKNTKIVLELEGKADQVKMNIRKNIPRAVFLPVDKPTFLMLLREEDAILDHAEDLVVWLGMRDTKIPEGLKEDFLEFLSKVELTLEAYEKAIGRMDALVESSFSKKEITRVREHIHEVHKYEFEADQVNHRLSKKVFQAEETLGPVGVMHLLKALNLLDKIANHAENAADRLRVLIAQ